MVGWPNKRLAVIGGVLVLGALTVALALVAGGAPQKMTEEECESDPNCEVLVVYGTRSNYGGFRYLYNGEIFEELSGYEPPAEPNDPDDPEAGDEWSCGPLLAEFNQLLVACLDRAKVEYARCLVKYRNVLELLVGEVLLEHCKGIRQRAERSCERQDEMRRGLLPPQCEVEQ